ATPATAIPRSSIRVLIRGTSYTVDAARGQRPSWSLRIPPYPTEGACQMHRTALRQASVSAALMSVFVVVVAAPQSRKANRARQAEPPPAPVAHAADSLNNLKFRNLGPSVGGGRVAAVAGVPGDRNVYYVGAAAGGVWKTTDGGDSWEAV